MFINIQEHQLKTRKFKDSKHRFSNENQPVQASVHPSKQLKSLKSLKSRNQVLACQPESVQARVSATFDPRTRSVALQCPYPEMDKSHSPLEFSMAESRNS